AYISNSGEPKTEKEALLCKTEEQHENQETAVPPEASDSGRPHSPLSTQLNHQEPNLSGSADQSKAPYSADVQSYSRRNKLFLNLLVRERRTLQRLPEGRRANSLWLKCEKLSPAPPRKIMLETLTFVIFKQNNPLRPMSPPNNYNSSWNLAHSNLIPLRPQQSAAATWNIVAILHLDVIPGVKIIMLKLWLNLTRSLPGPSSASSLPLSVLLLCHARGPGKIIHVGATSNSVLKTLFLCLSPFEEGGEKRHSAHISLPSESVQKDQSSMGDVFVQQQQKRKKKRRKKKTPYSQQQSTEKSVAHSTEHQPSSQTSLFSVEATARSTFSAPARTEPQVRNSGTHNSPFRPVTQLTQHHVRPSLKNNSEEGKWGNGNLSVTPLKDLFKTLDTTVFNLGH
ncbi:unnamed protein product, partial [Pleuronectes platessa]